MVAPPEDGVDTMHYASRVLRDELKAADRRLKMARNHLPPQLMASVGSILAQEWQPPPAAPDFEKASPPELAGQPWWEELRASLAQFEACHWDAPTRHRAFFSALRTLLSEIAAEQDPGSRAARLKAAHTWWAKHRPRGRAGNPAASAALAASLGITSKEVGGPSTAAPHRAASSSRTQDLTAPVSLAGTKHEFFAPFTRARSSSGCASKAQEDTAHNNSHVSKAGVPTTSTAAAIAHMPISRLSAAAVAISNKSMHSLPREQQAKRAPGKADAVKQSQSKETPSQPAGTPQGLRQGPLQAVGPAMVPVNKARVVFDPDRLEFPPGPATNTQGKSPSWFKGPYSTEAPVPCRPDSLVHTRQDTATEQGSIATLRQHQANIHQATERGTAHINQEMLHWAAQRARLEEEMVRRCEASRYAMPSTRHNVDSQQPASTDELSAYSGVTREAADSIAVGHQDMETAPDTLRLVPGLAPAPTLSRVAQHERTSAMHAYEYEAIEVAARMNNKGLVGALQPATLLKALAPVPDKPFLECLAKLPRPGSNLSSRPGSVRGSHDGRKSKK